MTVGDTYGSVCHKRGAASASHVHASVGHRVTTTVIRVRSSSFLLYSRICIAQYEHVYVRALFTQGSLSLVANCKMIGTQCQVHVPTCTCHCCQRSILRCVINESADIVATPNILSVDHSESESCCCCSCVQCDCFRKCRHGNAARAAPSPRFPPRGLAQGKRPA
jgi:hypothetical protein